PGGPPGDVLRAARLVVATSEWTARVLVERHDLSPPRVVVAAPGVDPAALATPSDHGLRWLCVGAVTRAKGHDVLFAALGRLGDRPWTCRCSGTLERDPEFVAAQRLSLE